MRKSALDLISSVRAMLGNMPNAVVSNAQILTVANDVLDFIAATKRPSELVGEWTFTTIPAQDVYQMPEDLARILDVSVDGVRIHEVAVSDLPHLDRTPGEPRYWMMWRPEDTPPYRQQVRLVPAPDASYEVFAAVVYRHRQLVESPVPTPIMLSHGQFLSLCEFVAEKIMLGFSPQESSQIASASQGRQEADLSYRYSSRGVSRKPGKVGGAIVPRSRRRSVW